MSGCCTYLFITTTPKRTQDQAPTRLEGQYSLSFIDNTCCHTYCVTSTAPEALCGLLLNPHKSPVKWWLLLDSFDSWEKMRPDEVTQLHAIPMGITGECRSMAAGASPMEARCLQFTEKDGARALGRCLVPRHQSASLPCISKCFGNRWHPLKFSIGIKQNEMLTL